MSMQPFQQRVVDEKQELDIKREALGRFKNSGAFALLPWQEQERLNTQGHLMTMYSAVLGERIANFEPAGIEMSMHTPGPWAHRNGRIFAVAQENLTIAHVARTADGEYCPANGDVLAAAPELLELLRDSVARHGCSCGHPACSDCEWTRAAQAAINKAEGES